MLTPLNQLNTPAAPPQLPISAAAFPAPFASGLEYNPPARGPWNIVHTGMLIPETHQIFACAQGCLRGVILTAAEMCAMDRMSWISVSEEEMFNGHLEDSIVEGAAQIVRALEPRPRAVLLFLSCIHLFAGCDFQQIIRELNELFPETRFVDCYMTPTMRQTKLNPDLTMRRQLYALLEPRPIDPRAVNIIGNDLAIHDHSELLLMLRGAGYTVRELPHCRSWEEYQSMAAAALNITTAPNAAGAAQELSNRLQTRHLHLPVTYDDGEIAAHYNELAAALGIPCPDFSTERTAAQAALAQAAAALGDTPVAIDAFATPRPLSLARRLLSVGINVQRIYADAFNADDAADFAFLQERHPSLTLYPIVNAAMLYAPPASPDNSIVCIGQKCTWYCQAPHFVNLISGGGYYGYAGLRRIAEELLDACRRPKDFNAILKHKGFGLPSCLGCTLT